MIYGVRPSGNQAQVALKMTAEKQKEKYPDAADSVINDIYADELATGTTSQEKADELASDVNVLAGAGGFVLKGWTIYTAIEEIVEIIQTQCLVNSSLVTYIKKKQHYLFE